MHISFSKFTNIKSKRLWVIIGGALVVSIFLILSVLYSLNKCSSNGMNFENLFDMLSKNELFNLSGYYSNAEITVVSNKNKNVYNVEEWYQKADHTNQEIFKFNIQNSDNSLTTYLFKNNTLQIKNTNQISMYNINEYIFKKTNLMSFATFLSIYEDSEKYKDKYFDIEETEDDNRACLKVTFKNLESIKDDKELYEKYIDIFNSGVKLKTIEAIIDKKKNIPLALNVYDNKNKIWIDIDYKGFTLNPKFDEKTFDF